MPGSACTPVPFQEGEQFRHDVMLPVTWPSVMPSPAEHGVPAGVPFPVALA